MTHTLLTTGILAQNRDENHEKQYPSLVAATLIHQSHQHAIPRFSARNATEVSAQVFPPRFWRVTNNNASTQKGFLQNIPKNLL